MVGSLLDPQLRRLIGRFFKLLVPTGPERLWSTDSANLPPAADLLTQNAEAKGNENKPNYSNRDFMNATIIFQTATIVTGKQIGRAHV